MNNGLWKSWNPLDCKNTPCNKKVVAPVFLTAFVNTAPTIKGVINPSNFSAVPPPETDLLLRFTKLKVAQTSFQRIRNTELVAVMSDEGIIIELGLHSELLINRQNGNYAKAGMEAF